MASDPLGFLLEQHRRLGPIFRLRAGHLKLVVMAGERANAFAQGEGAACLSNRETWAPTLRELGAPNNFVGLDGEPHRLLRKRFAGHFSRKAAEARLAELVDLTLAAFQEHSAGDEIPFVAFSQALASRQVGTLLVGRVPSRDEHAAILRYTNAVVMNLSLRRLPRWLFRLFQRRQLRRDREVAFRFARKLVAERDHGGFGASSNFIDRYRPPRDEHRRPDVFAPWGRGPHQCLGAGLAGVQMAATLATILHHCDIELAEPRRAFPHVLRPSLSLGSELRLRYLGWRRDPGSPLRAHSPRRDAGPRARSGSAGPEL